MATKFVTRFDHIITASDIKSAENLNISEASINELSKYVPYVDYKQNSDLFGLAFDVALVNVFNKNGDGISSEGAIKIAPTFNLKPINIEHGRETIIGHIISSAFTDISFKKELAPQDIKNKNIPFNITMGGVLYKLVAKELGELISEIQRGEHSDFKIAASWEIGFEKYHAAIGSDKLSECKIITDEEEVESVSKYMKAFGGKGVTSDGLPINRLIDSSGEMVFLGVGLTKYPAASVGPVYVFDYQENAEEHGENEEIEDKHHEESDDNQDDMKGNCDDLISHLKNNDVIDLRSEQTMNKEEIVQLVEEAVASIGAKADKESLANTTEKIAQVIVESNRTFVEEKEAAELKAAEIETKSKEQDERIASLERELADAATSLKTATEKLAQFEEEKLAAIAKETFNQRMSVIDEKFQLEDADREIIAKQISALASDEEFEEFSKSIEVLMSSKLKSKIQEAQAAEEKKMKEAVAHELQKRGIVDPLEKEVVELSAELPNNSAQASEETQSLKEKFSKAFDKNNIKVTL